jgi:hypothetical protein
MQKTLDQMNLQLHHVLTDLTGVTGKAIVRDILAGVRDPHKLAAHRHGGCKASEQENCGGPDRQLPSRALVRAAPEL